MDQFWGTLSNVEIVLTAVVMIILAVSALAVAIYYLITKWSD